MGKIREFKINNFSVGDIINLGNIKLKVVEHDPEYCSCARCYFCGLCMRHDDKVTRNTIDKMVGYCYKSKREDNKDVEFIKIR